MQKIKRINWEELDGRVKGQPIQDAVKTVFFEVVAKVNEIVEAITVTESKDEHNVVKLDGTKEAFEAERKRANEEFKKAAVEFLDNHGGSFAIVALNYDDKYNPTDSDVLLAGSGKRTDMKHLHDALHKGAMSAMEEAIKAMTPKEMLEFLLENLSEEEKE